MADYENRNRSRVKLHFKVRGQPYGVYTWSTRRRSKAGVIVRLGPLGHVQAQMYRGLVVGKTDENRRGKHSVALHCWGKKGRRRKFGVEFSIFV